MTTIEHEISTFDETVAPNFARAMPNWQPLVEYRRNGVAENTIHGAVSWVSGRNVIYSFGGNVEVYGRSMVKPIMMKVFRREFATALTSEQQAISCASHNGDTEHVAVARSILREAEWGLMQTPHDVPLVQFGRQVRRPRRWYHCCSGEHAAILHGCRLKGWRRVGYVWPHHPFFQEYLAYIRGVLGPEWKTGTIAKDGCGLPTVSNTVTDLARLFANLVTEKNEDWIWNAMVSHPDLIGGFNRLDSTDAQSMRRPRTGEGRRRRSARSLHRASRVSGRSRRGREDRARLEPASHLVHRPLHPRRPRIRVPQPVQTAAAESVHRPRGDSAGAQGTHGGDRAVGFMGSGHRSLGVRRGAIHCPEIAVIPSEARDLLLAGRGARHVLPAPPKAGPSLRSG
jgi:L-asparaginase II